MDEYEKRKKKALNDLGDVMTEADEAIENTM